VLHAGEASSLPSREAVTATDLAEALAERPWRWVRVVAEEFDNSLVDDSAQCCPSAPDRSSSLRTNSSSS
jgi:hypothetical protein